MNFPNGVYIYKNVKKSYLIESVVWINSRTGHGGKDQANKEKNDS